MNLYQVFSDSGPLAGNRRRFRFCPQCGASFDDRKLPRFIRQRCDGCGFVHHLNPTPGITMLVRSAGGEILIGKRRETARYGARWCLPGGYVEYEESFIDTAYREVREETGLEVRIDGIVNVVSNHLDDCHHTLVVVLLGEVIAGRPEPQDDLVALRWIDQQAHQGVDYAFEADRRIIDGYFTGTLQFLPLDRRIAPGSTLVPKDLGKPSI